MGRLVELKNEMVELEYSEFHYFDDILQDFKMTPVSDIITLNRIHIYTHSMLKLFLSLLVVDLEKCALGEHERFGLV